MRFDASGVTLTVTSADVILALFPGHSLQNLMCSAVPYATATDNEPRCLVHAAEMHSLSVAPHGLPGSQCTACCPGCCLLSCTGLSLANMLVQQDSSMDTRRLFAVKLHNTVQFYQQRASASTSLATRAAKWAACFPLAGADPEEQHVTIAYGHLREYVSVRRCDVCMFCKYAA